MASTNQQSDRNNGLIKTKLYNPKTDYKEYKPRLYVQPPYKDPLREPPRVYKGNFTIPKYKAYESKPFQIEYKEYKGPFIDPLTGKPYRRGRQRPKKDIDLVEEQKDEPISKTVTVVTPKTFPQTIGSTEKSVSRTFKLFESFDDSENKVDANW